MSDDKSEPALDIRGWCPGLQREWSVPGEAESRRIVGELLLSKRLKLKEGDVERHFRCGKLRIQSSDIVKGTLRGSMYQGSLLSLYADRNEGLVKGELIVGLTSDDFDALWARLLTPSSAYLDGTLLGTNYSQPVQLVNECAGPEIVDLRMRFVEREAVAPTWVQDAVAADIREALSAAHFGTSHADVVRIVDELSRSASQRPTTERSRTECFHAIADLLEDIRSAFRAALNLTAGEPSDAWALTTVEFAKAVSDRSSEDVSKLKRRYDTLWQHFNVASVIKRGESEYGATVEGLEPHVEQLETIAWKLLALPNMSSETLEWALVDALIYAECIAFAQTVASGETLLGYPVRGALKGATGAALWKAWGKQVWVSALALVVEALKIGVTLFIANILAQDNVQTAWVIATGVTVARWVRLGIAAQAKTPQQVVNDLIGKMVGAHELLKSERFNARALRQALYEVSTAGAVFSPWVYNILDARIRREGQT